jgi:hypothetical protein
MRTMKKLRIKIISFPVDEKFKNKIRPIYFIPVWSKNDQAKHQDVSHWQITKYSRNNRQSWNPKYICCLKSAHSSVKNHLKLRLIKTSRKTLTELAWDIGSFWEERKSWSSVKSSQVRGEFKKSSNEFARSFVVPQMDPMSLGTSLVTDLERSSFSRTVLIEGERPNPNQSVSWVLSGCRCDIWRQSNSWQSEMRNDVSEALWRLCLSWSGLGNRRVETW